MGPPLREVAAGQALGVASDAREAARTPRVQPRQPDEIKAVVRRDAARVSRIATAVEDRQIDPAEVGPKADAPHNAADPARCEVEFTALRLWLPHWPIRFPG